MSASTRFLIVCSTPRTGSTLLARLLQDSGACVGCTEYFDSNEVMPRELLSRYGFASLDAVKADLPRYVEAIKRDHAESGKILCIKLHWSQYLDWQPHGLDLERMFPGARYLQVQRRDVVAQTVSLVRASQTGEWTSSHRPSSEQEARYGFWRMMYELSGVIRGNVSWDQHFAEHCIEPYRLVYEDLDANFQDEATKVLRWLGLTVGPLMRRRLKASMSKQRDATNQEWEERFFRDLIHWHNQWEQLPIEERRRVWAREPG